MFGKKKNIKYYSWIPSKFTFETLKNKSRFYVLLAAAPCSIPPHCSL
jgi:hypothetical protein